MKRSIAIIGVILLGITGLSFGRKFTYHDYITKYTAKIRAESRKEVVRNLLEQETIYQAIRETYEIFNKAEKLVNTKKAKEILEAMRRVRIKGLIFCSFYHFGSSETGIVYYRKGILAKALCSEGLFGSPEKARLLLELLIQKTYADFEKEFRRYEKIVYERADPWVSPSMAKYASQRVPRQVWEAKKEALKALWRARGYPQRAKMVDYWSRRIKYYPKLYNELGGYLFDSLARRDFKKNLPGYIPRKQSVKGLTFRRKTYHLYNPKHISHSDIKWAEERVSQILQLLKEPPKEEIPPEWEFWKLEKKGFEEFPPLVVKVPHFNYTGEKKATGAFKRELASFLVHIHLEWYKNPPEWFKARDYWWNKSKKSNKEYLGYFYSLKAGPEILSVLKEWKRISESEYKEIKRRQKEWLFKQVNNHYLNTYIKEIQKGRPIHKGGWGTTQIGSVKVKLTHPFFDQHFSDYINRIASNAKRPSLAERDWITRKALAVKYFDTLQQPREVQYFLYMERCKIFSAWVSLWVQHEKEKMQIFNKQKRKRLKITGKLYLTEREKKQIWVKTWEEMARRGWIFLPGGSFLSNLYYLNHKG